MEHILLIDTSTDRCAVGITRDGQILEFLYHEDRQQQSAAIHLMINQLSASTGVPLSELNAIAVCSGPGSYTGLRIGMSVGKGLSYALQKPLMTQHKLELLAQQEIQVNEDYWHYGVVLTAREGEFFYASYDAEMNIIHQPTHGSTAEITEILQHLSVTSTCLIGDAPAQQAFGAQIKLVHDVSLPHWAPWAQEHLQLKDFADIASSVPFYMKEVYVQNKQSSTN